MSMMFAHQQHARCVNLIPRPLDIIQPQILFHGNQILIWADTREQGYTMHIAHYNTIVMTEDH